MIRNSLRFAFVVAAAAAVSCGACGEAQEGRPARAGAPAVSAFNPDQPALPPSAPRLAKPATEAAAPAPTGPGAVVRPVTVAPAPAKAPAPSSQVETPSRFASGLLAQNAARAELGLKPLGWAASAEADARAALASISALSCSRTQADRIAAAKDVSSYWAPAVRQLDGTGSVQELSSSFVVSEWLQERAHYTAAAGCMRKGACDDYLRMIRPAARTIGCAIAICADQSQVWACRYGE